MEVRTSKIYNDLPETIIKRSSALIDLPTKEPDDKPSKQQLQELLETHVPPHDKNGVVDEVR